MKKSIHLIISFSFLFAVSIVAADIEPVNFSSTGTNPCFVTINQDLTFTIPNATYDAGPLVGQMALKADFQFFGEQNGQLLWQLGDVDTSPSSASCLSVAPDLSFALTDAVYDAGPLVGQMTVQADFQYFGEQNGALLWFLADLKVNDAPSSTCGAYVAPGVWKQFDCYNLAAIGKTTNDDPFIPSWRLIGGYWQWGRKGPDKSHWYNTNTPNFAHGPTGPGSSEANEESIGNWSDDYAPGGSWSDSYKTGNDPCPDGFRVPTESQWEGVDDNNIQSAVGTWNASDTNYSSARLFGNDLMLQAAGGRNSSSAVGTLTSRGGSGFYWSSSEFGSYSAWYLYFSSGGAYASGYYRRDGYSVRCIAE